MLVLQTDYIDPVEEQRFVARIICDVCEQPIAGSASGFVVAPWRDEKDLDHPAVDKVLHVHRGQCLDKVMKESRRQPYREDLRRHLLEFIESTGFTPESLIRYRDEGE